MENYVKNRYVRKIYGKKRNGLIKIIFKLKRACEV